VFITDPKTMPIDTALVADCAAVIDVPKAAPPDSFVLHAPLELLARAILIERIPEPARPLAYERLEWLAGKYAAAGPSAEGMPEPAPPDGDELVLSLAAAGHAPILSSLRPRVPAVPSSFGGRLLAMELGRHPDWRLSWPTTRRTAESGSGDLAERLAAPPSPGDPGSDFIFPMMHLTDSSGLAADVLDEPLRGMGVAEARRVLLRVAAQSMLQDDPVAAAYQWTHCLTMPQAVLVAAEHGTDPDLAVAVAATQVLAFRATKGRVRLDPAWTPASHTAACRVWSAADEELPDIIQGLATFGAIHPDAHLTKYTLACLDAADADPDARRLFLAAAAHLHDWWKKSPPDGDPILARLTPTSTA
jgi:hypothetical protein